MARSFGISDFITLPQDRNTGGVISFWMRTTQTSATWGNGAEIISHHNSSGSFGGYGILLATGGKLYVYGKQAVGGIQVFTLVSTTVINDGNWHHVGVQLWYAALANGNQLYIDGNLEAQVDAGATWGGATDPLRLGRTNDTFWNGYIGELAEVGIWAGGLQSLRFTPDQFISLAKGYAPDKVWKGDPAGAGALHVYLPLTRSVQCKVSEQGTPTVSGTSVSDHPRIIGSTGP
jgi:hypothetical protein